MVILVLSYEQRHKNATLLVPKETDIPLPGHRLRTENLFMDNPSDCDFLLSEEGRQALVDLHVDGICAYLAE